MKIDLNPQMMQALFDLAALEDISPKLLVTRLITLGLDHYKIGSYTHLRVLGGSKHDKEG